MATEQPPDHRNPDLLEKLYWDEEMSLREVADEVGVVRSTVARNMTNLGIDRRDSGGHYIRNGGNIDEKTTRTLEILKEIADDPRRSGRVKTKEVARELEAESAQHFAPTFTALCEIGALEIYHEKKHSNVWEIQPDRVDELLETRGDSDEC